MAINQETGEQYTPLKENLYSARGGATTFEDGKYDISNYTYPDDLYSNKGTYGGNYAVFYINVSEDSKLIKKEGAETVAELSPRDRGDLVAQGLSANQLATANATATGIEGAIGGGLLSGNLKGAAVGAAGGALVGGASGYLVGKQAQSMRQQKRLKTAIALHIPNELSVNYGMQWSEEDTGALAMAAAGTGAIMKALTGGGKLTDVTGVGADILTNIALSKGPNAGALSAASGIAANPKKEQVFKGVDFRTFQFAYNFFPRSSNEAKNVLEIIKQFKYHMHPEFKDGNNFVYLYPSEFDIFYYQDAKENLNLHRHTSCVLTSLNVNYTPNGQFTTFADGMPTQINITLDFRELALLTKDKIKDYL